MSTVRRESNGLAMAVIVEGSLTLAALVIARIFHISLRDQFVSSTIPLKMRILHGLLATVPMLVVFWGLVQSSRTTLRQLRTQVEWLIGEMFPTSSIPQFALVAVLAGVGEELLFRGVLQTLLGQWTTPIIGLVIASLLFGLAHALSVLYFVFAVAVGICFGWLVMDYNDLVAPIVAHSLYDFLALVYLSRSAAKSREVTAIGQGPADAAEQSSKVPDERTDG